MKEWKNSGANFESDRFSLFRIRFLSSLFKIFSIYLKHLKLQMPPIHDEHADIYYSDGHGLKRDCVFV